MAELEKNKIRQNTRAKKSTIKTEETGRLQPQARDLEEAILGALMLEKDAYSIISEIISPVCFYI